jgi:hypothetical protein
MKRMWGQATATTIRLSIVVDHMVKGASIIREGGVLTDSIVEDEGAGDLGDAGGEDRLEFLMLLCRHCHRRSVTYSSCVGLGYV